MMAYVGQQKVAVGDFLRRKDVQRRHPSSRLNSPRVPCISKHASCSNQGRYRPSGLAQCFLSFSREAALQEGNRNRAVPNADRHVRPVWRSHHTDFPGDRVLH
jgi:hypothetical protein